MKKVLLFIISILVIGLFVTSSGYAYDTWSGCKGCHPQGILGTATRPQLHGISSHTANCANCHAGTPGVGNVYPSACIVCHPRTGDTGVCQLIAAQASHGSTCLACHASGPPTPCETIVPPPVSCTYTISPNGKTFRSNKAKGSVRVLTQSGCEWTASSDALWIHITSAFPVVGSGKVNYTIEANTSTTSREGTLTIAGQRFTIQQAGRLR
jgi:hypothetical protein